MKRRHVIAVGRVQGVAFRAWTRKTALSLHLTGWVRNLPDGSVEAVFEGPDEEVELMVRRCAVGPLLAKVTDLAVREEAYRGEFVDFVIRHDL
ncbi:MAG: acylphosphatase [Pseudomonadota bacterium]|nr:acylphosphatase [Pseudomonadota bacterium]